MRTAPQDTRLFDPEQRARRRRNDPITSFWAAQGIDVNRRQGMVLTAFIYGNATHDELIDRVREIYDADIAESTVRTGCSELVEKGLVECVGPIGKSRRGQRANVYRKVT